MASPDGSLVVEVVCLTAGQPVCATASVPRGASLRDAIELSGIAARVADLDLGQVKTGIYGRVLPGSALVEDGDRVEIYRPLIADPKDARRRRVKPRRPRS